jgi:hypothetical protein
MSLRTTGTAVALALALIATDESWAARTGGTGARSSGGSRGGARFGGTGRMGSPGMRSYAAPRFSRPIPVTSAPAPYPYRFHGRSVIFIGAPFMYWSWPYGYYYLPPPYYYGPDYVAREELPAVFVERFEGQPTPDTPGEIYCPGENAYYPDVQDCPSGWQRIIREEEEVRPEDVAG